MKKEDKGVNLDAKSVRKYLDMKIDGRPITVKEFRKIIGDKK